MSARTPKAKPPTDPDNAEPDLSNRSDRDVQEMLDNVVLYDHAGNPTHVGKNVHPSQAQPLAEDELPIIATGEQYPPKDKE